MSRRRRAEKRTILPDAKIGDITVSKFMNNVMLDGKKSVAERIVYGALELMQKRSGNDPVKAFHDAIENVRPHLEVRSRRFGGATGFCGGRYRRRHGRGSRTFRGGQHRRRIEKNGVFSQQTPARPADIDQERNEWLADRVARPAQLDAPAILSAADAELAGIQDGRAVETVTGEHFVRGEVCFEGTELRGCRGDEVDLGGERLIERRIEADLAETEAQGHRRRQEKRRN